MDPTILARSPPSGQQPERVTRASGQRWPPSGTQLRWLLFLKKLLLREAVLRHELLELVEGVTCNVDRIALPAVFIEWNEDGTVVWDEVDAEAYVAVRIPLPQDEPPDLRQLVQASAGTCPDLALEMPGSLPFEALLLHQLVDLLRVVATQVQALNLLAMLVEEDEVRVVMGNEVDLQPSIGVSVARLLHEPAHLRQLIQASARAALHLCGPSALNRHGGGGGAFAVDIAFCLPIQEAQAEELHQVLALPAGDIRAQHAAVLLAALQLNCRRGPFLVLHLQAREERRLSLDKVVQVLVPVLLGRIRDEAGSAEALDRCLLPTAAQALLYYHQAAALSRLCKPLLKRMASAARQARRIEAQLRATRVLREAAGVTLPHLAGRLLC
mmetsp:Transcript_115030/g.245695  ORF Transcript_115030/g.245695 Transcript_115030/m.245695 type:complete len:384 (-) Transcript_115030:129-1280(-)